MSKFLFLIFLLLLNVRCLSQNGLEQVIIEKYYISDSNDASADATDGVLPVGSVTYRVYLDLRPGYIFQSAYGDINHDLKIATTTTFFNNESRGAIHPNYKLAQAKSNTVMLDSWLSAGAACTGQIGVLKSDDNGIATVVNADGLLQNQDPRAGIPLTQQDGMVAGNPASVVTVGISSEVAIFDNENTATNGSTFITNNGAWASLQGGKGADSLTNKVLIGQFTTNGTFSFELNIQIRSPNLIVEQYVAKNSVGNELLFPGLNYNSDTLVGTKILGKNQIVARVYPNPASNYLHFECSNNFNSNLQYCISNLSGSDLIKGNIETDVNLVNHYLDISNLPDGMYLLKVYNNEFMQINKFLKK